jgi:hypothetical protein
MSPRTWRRVAPVRTDVSEESTISIIRATRIGELGITLAVLAIEAGCQEILCCIYLTKLHGVVLHSWSSVTGLLITFVLRLRLFVYRYLYMFYMVCYENLRRQRIQFCVIYPLRVHSKGFWRWCVTLITIKLLDFVHRPPVERQAFGFSVE